MFILRILPTLTEILEATQWILGEFLSTSLCSIVSSCHTRSGSRGDSATLSSGRPGLKRASTNNGTLLEGVKVVEMTHCSGLLRPIVVSGLFNNIQQSNLGSLIPLNEANESVHFINGDEAPLTTYQ